MTPSPHKKTFFAPPRTNSGGVGVKGQSGEALAAPRTEREGPGGREPGRRGPLLFSLVPQPLGLQLQRRRTRGRIVGGSGGMAKTSPPFCQRETVLMLLTIKDLSKQLQVTPSTLYAWVAQRKIPFVKLHRLIRFRSEDIEQWLGSLNKPLPPFGQMQFEKKDLADIDVLIARAKRQVYTGPGETRPISGSIGKEVRDGAV
ncbi:MAG: DNA-binding protein [Nitrospirae bacterium]|nr:MAG: DNA-binding protein [Nitrospirota bacterium]